jgi:hypothetical protein
MPDGRWAAVAVENEAGQVLSSRENPRSAFRDPAFETPWDNLHVPSRFLRISRVIHGSKRRTSTPMVCCGATSIQSTSLEGRMDSTTRTMPTTRRVFAYDENKHRVPAPVLVAIDIGHVAFAK